MGRGWHGPEEELEAGSFFYVQVEADADGGEVVGRHLLAHVVDGLDDVGQGEGAGHDAGGEETEEGRLQREACGELGGVRPREAGLDRAEGAQVAGPGPLDLGVPEVLHELAIAATP